MGAQQLSDPFDNPNYVVGGGAGPVPKGPVGGGLVDPFDDPAFGASTAQAPAPKAPEQTMSTGRDVAYSAATGVAKGVGDLIGLPGDILSLLRTPMDKGFQWALTETLAKLGVMTPDQAKRLRELGSDTRHGGGTTDVNSAIGTLVGGYHEPQTEAGKAAENVARFIPGGALGAGEGQIVRGLVKYGALPGVTSEVAGQVTKGTELEPVARLAGALAPAGVAAAGSKVANVARPLFNPTAVAEEGAGAALLNSAADKAGLVAGIDNAISARTIPGRAPMTTAQELNDPGVLALERSVSRSSPEAVGDFQAQRTAQNEAITKAIRSIAPDITDDQVRAAQNAVEVELAGVGHGASADAVGGAVRTVLTDARKSAKTAESKLWNDINPDDNLALDVSPVKTMAGDLSSRMSKSTKPMEGEEAEIFRLASEYSPTQKFSELSDLRGRLLGAIRDEKFKNGQSPSWRRMTMLRQSMDDAIGKAGKALPEAAPSAAPRPAAGPQSSGEVFTPGGMKINTQFEVVDLAGPNAPVVSHTPDFQPNARFPQQLQPRDRSRAASEAQVTKMAGELNPSRLGAGGVGEGAPIIGLDGVVESGNGRMMALQKAYANNGTKAKEYRDWLAAQGYDATGMQAPVLVRRRTNRLSDQDRVRFVEEANQGPGVRLSAVEQAKSDAGRVTDDVLSQYRGGAIDAAENREFARAFVGKLGGNEAGSLAARDGTLSVEGVKRIQSAMLAKALGGDSALVTSLLETGDDSIKALGRAIADASPGVAKLKAAIARGDVPRDFDPTQVLTDAAKVVQQARKQGVPLGDVLAQQDAFNPLHPMTETFLKAAYGDGLRRVSYGRASEALKTYLDDAARQTGGDMFGGGPSAADVWGAARRKAAGVADDAAPAAEAVPPPPAGPASVVPDELSPNFTADDAKRYRAAADATKQRKATFDSGKVGEVLRAGPDGSEFKVADSAVASKVFGAGPGKKEATQGLIDAMGAPATKTALRDTIAAEVLRDAVDASGNVVQVKLAAITGRYRDSLSLFPDLQKKFASIGEAQEAVGRLVKDKELITKFMTSMELAERDAMGNQFISPDKFRKFIRDNRADLDRLLPPGGMDRLKMINEELQTINRSVTSKLPGGSDTAQNQAGMSVVKNLVQSIMRNAVSPLLAGSVGAVAGGPVGAIAAASVGAAADRAITQALARQTELTNQLLAKAMLDPAVAKLLLSKSTARNELLLRRQIDSHIRLLPNAPQAVDPSIRDQSK